MRRAIPGQCEKRPCSDTRDEMAILCSLMIDFAGVGLCWYQIVELPETNAWIYMRSLWFA